MDNNIILNNVDKDEHHVIFPYKWNNEILPRATRTKPSITSDQFYMNLYFNTSCAITRWWHFYLEINWRKKRSLITNFKIVRMSWRKKKNTNWSINQTSHSKVYIHIFPPVHWCQGQQSSLFYWDVAHRHWTSQTEVYIFPEWKTINYKGILLFVEKIT
jgi:hypothetical protein